MFEERFLLGQHRQLGTAKKSGIPECPLLCEKLGKLPLMPIGDASAETQFLHPFRRVLNNDRFVALGVYELTQLSDGRDCVP
jgi:hypothetical protein